MSQGKYQNKRRKGRKNAYLFPVLLAVGGVLLIAAAALGLSRGSGGPANFTPEVTGAPSLKTDQETVDLGDVRLGQMVQVKYQLTNVGDKSLSFTQDPYIEVVEGC